MKHINRKTIPFGFGSLLPQNKNFDRPSRALEAIEALAKNGPALEFVTSDGWKSLTKAFETRIEELEEHLLYLAEDADKNKDKIQRSSDFIKAFKAVIFSTNVVVATHLGAMEKHNKNKET